MSGNSSVSAILSWHLSIVFPLINGQCLLGSLCVDSYFGSFYLFALPVLDMVSVSTIPYGQRRMLSLQPSRPQFRQQEWEGGEVWPKKLSRRPHPVTSINLSLTTPLSANATGNVVLQMAPTPSVLLWRRKEWVLGRPPASATSTYFPTFTKHRELSYLSVL